jgi:hypothetical protein
MFELVTSALIVPLNFVVKLPVPCCWNAAPAKVPEMLTEELVASSANVFSSARLVVETRQHTAARSADRLKGAIPEYLQQVEFMLVVGLVLVFPLKQEN